MRLPFISSRHMANPNNKSLAATAGPTLTERAWRYGPLVLWMVVISIFSAAGFSSINTSRIIGPLLLWLFPKMSKAQLAHIHFLIRKAGHLTEYAILAFLLRRAFITSSRAFIQRHWFELGSLIIVCYALLDEFHQSFVPSRTASIYDSAIDVTGGLIVLVLYKLQDQWSYRRKLARG